MHSKRNNKVFFTAVNTGYVDNSLPNEQCYEFYARRSLHGLYCAIVGNVVLPDGVGSNESCAVISDSANWKKLADAIRENGAIPGIQLATAWSGYRGMRTFVSSHADLEINKYKLIPESMSSADVIRVFGALDLGTKLAVEAGFRHIQLHAAHGYLFSLLVDGRFSPHSQLSLHLIADWADSIRSCGAESSLRFSLSTGGSSIDSSGRLDFLDAVSNLPVDYLDASSGFYNINKRLIYPTSSELLKQRRDEGVALAKRHPNVQFIITGKSMGIFDDELPNNIHAGICRDLIANPDFLRDRVAGCNNSMKCHYFSRGERHLTCGRWDVGSEHP